MALTLEEAKVGYADKVEQNVIDEFRRSSILLDKLIFMQQNLDLMHSTEFP